MKNTEKNKPGKKTHKTGIRRKIIFFICLSTFIVSFSGIVMSYLFGYRFVQETIGSGNVEVAQSLANAVSGFIDREIETLQVFMTNPLYVYAIAEGSAKYKDEDRASVTEYFLGIDKEYVESGADSALVMKYTSSESAARLKRYCITDTAIAEIFITDTFGGLIAASAKTTDFYQADEKWWQEAYNNGKGGIYIGDIEYDESANAKAMVIAIPVKDRENNVVGVCKAVLNTDKLFSPVYGVKVGYPGYAVLVSGKGDIICQSESRYKDTKMCSDKDFENLIKSRKGWRVIKTNQQHGQEDEFVATAIVKQPILLDKGSIWRICINQEVHEVFYPINRFFSGKAIILAIMILLFIPISFIFGSILVKPIRMLHEAVEHIEAGEMEYPIEIKTNDEIEQFADSFKSMVATLKSKQESLQKANQYIENIISSLTDTLLVLDPDGKIKRVNKAVKGLLDYEEEELIGKDVSMIFSEEDQGIFKQYTIEQLAGNDPWGKDLKYRRKNGDTIFVNFSGSAMRDKDGQFIGMVGIGRDMREIKGLIAELERSKIQLEEFAANLEEKVQERTIELKRSQEGALRFLADLQEAKDELEKKLNELQKTQKVLIRQEKLASIGKIVADVAHEVNNPLMIVSGRAQLSLMEETSDEEIKENLRIILDQCMRAKDITQRLLVFSAPGKGIVSEVDINGVIGFVVKLIKHQYELININIVEDYAKEIPLLNFDENQMHEVFINLLKNAAEAMPEGGTITIATEKYRNNVRVTIEDTGEGIERENIQKVFDPFFTTKKTGTGLGLSVCYGIVNRHGGEIEYKSEPGKGTTVMILLPVSEPGHKERRTV